MTEDSTQSTKHTPGPWSALMGLSTFGPSGRFSICRDTDDAERTLICEMPHSSPGGLSLKKRAANAHLIAAAPLMLAALKFARSVLAEYADDLGNGGAATGAIDILDPIIAKAGGETE